MIVPVSRQWLVVWLVALPACSSHALLSLGRVSEEPNYDEYQGTDALLALRPLAPDGHVRLEPAFELDFSDHFTLEAWVFPHSTRGGALFCKVGNSESKRITLEEGSLAVSASLRMASIPEPEPLQATGALEPHTWHHVALSYDRSKLELFVDGVPAAGAAATYPVVDESTPAYLGACLSDDPHSEPADVSLSDMRFSRVGRYDGAFTPEPRLAADPSASALFRLGDGMDGALTDSSTHDLSGAAVAPVQWTRLPPR